MKMINKHCLFAVLLLLAAGVLLGGCFWQEEASTGDEVVAPADPPGPALLASPTSQEPDISSGTVAETEPPPTPERVSPSGLDLTPPPSLEELLDRYPELASLLENLDLTVPDQLERAYGQMKMLYENEGLAGLHHFMRESGVLEALNLDSNYVDFVIAYDDGGLETARQLAQERHLLTGDNALRLILVLDTEDITLVGLQITAVGARIVRQYQNEVEIAIPLSRLVELASSQETLAQLVRLAHLEHVISVRAPDYSPPNKGPGSDPNGRLNQDEGVDKTSAVQWHAAGLVGTGIRVGIIDPEGFGRYQEVVGAGLPAGERLFVSPDFDPVFLNEQTGLHGTACAEIVHAMAPDASLYLAYSAGTYQGLGRAVDWLLASDVDIISYSAGSIVGPMDGTGKMAALVQQAAEQDVLWVNASGNHAQAHLNILFADTDDDGWHNFSGGGESLPLTLIDDQALVALGLTWNDRWGGASQDYDLYIIRQPPGEDTPEIVASQRNFQGGRAGDEPYELLITTLPEDGEYFLAVRGNDPDYRGRLNILGHGVLFGQSMPAGSLATPADAAGALTVGATLWRDDTVEVYSSRGPTGDGRGKPELAAPSGVMATSYGGVFYGTSPSAPFAAGAAALVWQAFPESSAAEVRGYLMGNAVDLEPAGFDNATGAGRLNLPPLPAAVSSPEGHSQANIYTVWQEHNVYEGNQKGMKIHARFDVTNFQGQTGNLRAHFFNKESGRPLVDSNQLYRGPDGQVMAAADFTPRHPVTYYADEALFLPYEELDLGPGDYTLEFVVEIVAPAGGPALAQTGPVAFAYSQNNPARPAATIVDIYFAHDTVQGGESGLGIAVTFDVTNFQDRDGAVIAYFYFDGPANRPLRDYNGRYRTAGDAVAVARLFTAKDEEESFKRFSLFIPYEEMHLSTGQHNLKFYIAVRDVAGGVSLATSEWIYFWHAEGSA